MDSLKRTSIGAGVTIALFALLAVSPLAQSVRQIGPGLLPFGCTNGQVPVYNTTTRVWECGSGGGGGSFDQELNTTDSVQFASVLVSKADENGASHLNLYNATADESFQVNVYDDGHALLSSPQAIQASNGFGSFLAVGTAPFPSTGAVRLGDAGVDGDTNGIWGYESQGYGGQIALLRLVRDEATSYYGKIVIGDDDYGSLTFDPQNGELFASNNYPLGKDTNRFSTAFISGIDALGDNFSILTDNFLLLNVTDASNRQSAIYMLPSNETADRPYIGFFSENGFYFSHPPASVNTAAEAAILWPIDAYNAFFYGADQSGNGNYYEWYDSRGVFRIREDDTFDSVGQAIPALYNPQFTKYVPDAVNYERMVLSQWNGNVAEIGTQAGGTGTLRNVRFIGGDFEMQGILTATGGYKSSDGSAGVTAAACAAFKNGLCTTSVAPNAPTIESLQREIAELRELIASLLPTRPQR